MSVRSFQDEIARNKRDSFLLAVVVSTILFLLVVSISYTLSPESGAVIVPIALVGVLG